MLKVSENSVNYVYVNCSRNKSLNRPTYLFSVVNQYNQLTKRFIPENISFTGNTDYEYLRYDKFRFYVSGDTSENYIYSTGNPVYLDLEPGMYYYKIYEQVSSSNLDPSLSHDVLDEGIMYVNKDGDITPSYTGYSNNSISIYE